MNTYSQLYVQIVFGVKYREALIDPKWEKRLFQYMTNIIQNKGQKMLAINGTMDHIHIFINCKPTCNLSDLVREVKKSSTVFINENYLTQKKFNWQSGFGVFSYNYSQIDQVIKYVHRQKEHHKKKSFKTEYLNLLKEMNIDFQEQYAFDELG